MKHETMSIESFARPLNAECFQVFLIEADQLNHTLWLTYKSGSKDCKRYAKHDEILLRELAMNPTVREWFLELYGPDVEISTLSEYFADRMVFVLSYLLSEHDTRFMILRGSEVSLDRLVQLQE